MAIYDRRGNEKLFAYNRRGERIRKAYDSEGNLAFKASYDLVDYDTYTYTTLWTSANSYNSPQGFECMNGYIFWFRSTGELAVLDAETGAEVIGSVTIPCGHGNNATFTNIYYDESDEYPLLLVGDVSAPYLQYLYRITSCSSEGLTYELIRKLTFPTDVYPMSQTGQGKDVFPLSAMTEPDGDTLVSYGIDPSYQDTSGDAIYIICWWDLKSLTDNGDGTYTPALIRTIRTEGINPWQTNQGAKEFNGYIWIATSQRGSTNSTSKARAIDPITGEIVHVIDFNTTTEIEGILFIVDENAPGKVAMLAGFPGVSMRKYTFGDLGNAVP